jgi:CRP/FNR family cyclic AMP-dependent transcriptional regulator
MLERFQGDAGRRLTIDALVSQRMVAGSLELAEWLADRVHLSELSAGGVLIEQGGSDNDVFLILAGAFDVVVNKRRVARRFANDHVGEMAAIEPSQSRAATVQATELSVVARLTESDLAIAAQRHPEIYRCIARELSKRLHQRNAHVGAARDRTKVFIISSVESLGVARAIQNALSHDPFLTTVWTDGVFRVANYPLQSLLDAVDDSDFAVAIAHSDDTTAFRGANWPVPRDNVVFELGLFMGRLGKDRAILMEPRDKTIKLPSDLTGISTIMYRYEQGGDIDALMGPACNQLRDHIKRLGPNN